MNFRPGRNIAVKVPEHEYLETVRFYREVLKLEDASEYSSNASSAAIKFGDKVLWIDRVETLSQTEVWLEIRTDNVDQAKAYLAEQQISFRSGIEPLPDGIDAFWISAPGNLIHLIHADKP